MDNLLAPGNEPLVGKGKKKPKSPYGLREDGSPKGKGYLGLIPTGNGDEVMSEKSISVGLDGKEVLIPLIVPTLDKKEVDILKNHKGPVNKLPQKIIDKAVRHAQERMKSGKSPFYD